MKKGPHQNTMDIDTAARIIQKYLRKCMHIQISCKKCGENTYSTPRQLYYNDSDYRLCEDCYHTKYSDICYCCNDGEYD